MIINNPQLFHDGGCYYIETSPLICRANQLTGFYMIMASIMKELKSQYQPKKNSRNLKSNFLTYFKNKGKFFILSQKMSPELQFQTTAWVYTDWQLKKNLMAPFHGWGSTA